MVTWRDRRRTFDWMYFCPKCKRFIGFDFKKKEPDDFTTEVVFRGERTNILTALNKHMERCYATLENTPDWRRNRTWFNTESINNFWNTSRKKFRYEMPLDFIHAKPEGSDVRRWRTTLSPIQ